MDRVEQFWWERITGPSSFIHHVGDLLHQNFNVALKVPGDLPWRHQMRQSIQATFKEISSSDELTIHWIDVRDEYQIGLEPGRFLMEQASDARTRTGYREQSGKSLQTYLIERKALQNTLYWIKGLSRETAGTWIEFVKDYPCRSWRDGIFVLEIPEEIALAESKHLKRLSFREYVSRYDLQILNMMILDEDNELTVEWKRYLATLAAQLCVFDSEVSWALLKRCDLRKAEPLECLKGLAESECFALRGLEPASDHIFSLVRTDRKAEIHNRIWNAQIEALLPMIETQRQQIIQELDGEIRECLAREQITQYEVPVVDPLDLELGTIVYLMHHRTSEWEYALYVGDDQLRDLLELLRESRNRLAHTKVCPIRLVEQLLDVN